MVAMIVSIVSICIAAYRSPELGFDYQGVLVGILTLLVTVLIGWQIYILFDLRKIREEIDIKRQLVNMESERNMCVSAMSLSDFYYSLLVNEPVKDKEFKYLNYRIAALLHASKIGDIGMCNAIVRALLESVKSELRISKYNKKLLLDILQDIREPKKITDFYALLCLVVNIQELADDKFC
jgi:hypothetical protein